MHDRILYAQLVCQAIEYDQLYIENRNTSLRFSGNLFEGARAGTTV